MGRAYYRHVSSKWLLAASPSQAGEEGPAAGSRGKGNKAKGKGRATSTKKKKQQQQQQAVSGGGRWEDIFVFIFCYILRGFVHSGDIEAA